MSFPLAENPTSIDVHATREVQNLAACRREGLVIKSNQSTSGLRGRPMIDLWYLAEDLKQCSLGLPHWGACVHYPWNLRFFQKHRQLHFSKHHLASCASRIHDELCCML